MHHPIRLRESVQKGGYEPVCYHEVTYRKVTMKKMRDRDDLGYMTLCPKTTIF